MKNPGAIWLLITCIIGIVAGIAVGSQQGVLSGVLAFVFVAVILGGIDCFLIEKLNKDKDDILKK